MDNTCIFQEKIPQALKFDLNVLFYIGWSILLYIVQSIDYLKHLLIELGHICIGVINKSPISVHHVLLPSYCLEEIYQVPINREENQCRVHRTE